MKRVVTVDDFERDEYKRSKAGVVDPLEDPSLSMVEKTRLASMWEVVSQNRHNPARMHELLAPMMHLSQSTMPIPFATGLQMACLYGDINLAKMLVSRGENMDQVVMSPDNFGRGRCPMSVAAELGHNNILEFLISAGGDARNMHDPPLRQAVRRNDVQAVTMLVKGGADPDPTLHQLLWPSCNTAIIRMLLDAGATPSATMLLTALWRGCEASVIELLLAFGAPFRSDLENESALEVAICRGADRHVVEVLLNAPARWLPSKHKMYPRAFRERVATFALVNGRLDRAHKLPASVVTRVVSWVATLEKADSDVLDLQRSIHSVCDAAQLEQRLHALGLRGGASKAAQSSPSETMSNSASNGAFPVHTSYDAEPFEQQQQQQYQYQQHQLMQHFYMGQNGTKAQLSELSPRQLLSVLWYEDAHPVQHSSRVRVKTSAGGSGGGNSYSDGTMEYPSGGGDASNEGHEDELWGEVSDFMGVAGDHDAHDPDSLLQRKIVRPPTIVSSDSSNNYGGGSGGGGGGGGSNGPRRVSHPVADARNPNSPKPHHCTCCHVCHVSMKQRPRPIAACSLCNTIICKLCLQDRWKSDQWDEACSQSGWVCHKCKGTCVCKSCKSKGSRTGLPGGTPGINSSPTSTPTAVSGR